MSYCGACGSFFWPGCPRRQDGMCIPAPNPYEEHAAQLHALAVEASAKINGMVADNRLVQIGGVAPLWTSQHFQAAVEDLTRVRTKP